MVAFVQRMRTARSVQGARHRRDDRLDQRAGRPQHDEPRPADVQTRSACCSSTATTSRRFGRRADPPRHRTARDGRPGSPTTSSISRACCAGRARRRAGPGDRLAPGPRGGRPRPRGRPRGARGGHARPARTAAVFDRRSPPSGATRSCRADDGDAAAEDPGQGRPGARATGQPRSPRRWRRLRPRRWRRKPKDGRRRPDRLRDQTSPFPTGSGCRRPISSR